MPNTKLLLVDNYDSFTFNLVELLRKYNQGVSITVIRNDKIDLDAVKQFDKILLSPGPSLPDDAGDMKKLIAAYASSKPILGVCLGHQAIAEVMGCKLRNLEQVLHGIQSTITVNGHYLYEGMDKSLAVGRYHSWVIDEETVTEQLEVTGKDENGQIMSISHKQYDVNGVQFHPESVMTPEGIKMLQNWINH